MRVFILALFLLFSEKHFAGCGGPRCYTNIGINFLYGPTARDTAFVNQLDSFTLYVRDGGCWELNQTTVYFNGKKILSSSSKSCFWTLLKSPGDYRVVSSDSYNNTMDYYFTLIPRIKTEETTTSAPEAIETAIQKIESSNTGFSFYPNPVTENLTLSNENEVVKSVTIFSMSGEIMLTLKSDSNKVFISTSNYPAGIYIMHVATLSDKIIIRKIIVL